MLRIASLVASLATGAGAGTTASSPFAAPFRAYAAGELPVALAAGDLDGDGRADLVVADAVGDRVQVLRAQVDGSLAPAAPFDTADGPVGVAVADLDGDADLDAVVACAGADVLVLLVGRGDGVFDRGLDLPAGIDPSQVVAADLDHDGDADLVVLLSGFNNPPGTVEVRLGRGDGTFAPPVEISTGGSPNAMRIADVDGDGHLDLAVANSAPDELAVLHGAGDGTFPSRTAQALAGTPTALVVDRLDADARADVAVFHEHFEGSIPIHRIAVFAGEAGGTLVPRGEAFTDAFAVDLGSGDLDGDGDADLVALGARASVLLGRGDATFGFPRPFDAGASPQGLLLADADGDARLDVAVVAAESRAVCVLGGNGDGTFGIQPVYTGANPQSVFLGDLDGDGKLDLAMASQFADAVSVHRGLGNGGFGVRRDLPTGRDPSCVGAADLNADGRPDLLVATFDGRSGFVSVLVADGAGGYVAHRDVPLAGPATCLVLGDWNGDGRRDAAATLWTEDYPADGGLQLLFGDGFGGVAPGPVLAVGPLPMGLAAGDLDGDGDADLVATFRRVAGGVDGGVSILLGQGDGGFAPRTDVFTGDEPRGVAIGDLDADGVADLVVANSGFSTQRVGDVTVLRGSGGGVFTRGDGFVTGSETWAVALADFDRDGRLDVAATNAGSHTVAVLLGRGDTSLAPRLEFGAGPRPVGLAVGDVDGDRRPDLVTANSAAATATVLLDRLVPVPVAVSELTATWVEERVQLAWTLGSWSGVRAVQVERATAATGPWVAVVPPLAPASRMRCEDPDPPPLGRLWYHVVLVDAAGEMEASAAVEVERPPESSSLGLDIVAVTTSGVTIGYRTGPDRRRSTLDILDVRGRCVRRLVDGAHAAGSDLVVWDRCGAAGRRVPRGVYWVHLASGGRSVVRRLVLLHS